MVGHRSAVRRVDAIPDNRIYIVPEGNFSVKLPFSRLRWTDTYREPENNELSNFIVSSFLLTCYIHIYLHSPSHTGCTVNWKFLPKLPEIKFVANFDGRAQNWKLAWINGLLKCSRDSPSIVDDVTLFYMKKTTFTKKTWCSCFSFSSPELCSFKRFEQEDAYLEQSSFLSLRPSLWDT